RLPRAMPLAIAALPSECSITTAECSSATGDGTLCEDQIQARTLPRLPRRSKVDCLFMRDQLGLDVVALLDEPGKRFARAIFTVGEENPWLAVGHGVEPPQ